MKNIIYILLLNSFLAQAQDIHFSQFYLAPMSLNPAMTGAFDHGARIYVNARNQWRNAIGANAYNTVNFATDFKFPVREADFLSVGTTITKDKAGTSNFERNQFMISSSYAKQLGHKKDKQHYLTAGIETGLNNFSLNPQDLRFLQQFNASDVFDPNLPAPMFQQEYRNLNFFDLNAGLLWMSSFNKYYSFYIGGAMHHANRPNVAFVGEKKMLARYTVHFGGTYIQGDKRWAITPNIVAMRQGKSLEINAGAGLRKTLQWEKSQYGYKAIQAGVWLRFNNKLEHKVLADAMIFSLRFETSKYIFGVSYDTNISSLRISSPMNGAYELSIHRFFDFKNAIGPVCGDKPQSFYYW